MLKRYSLSVIFAKYLSQYDIYSLLIFLTGKTRLYLYQYLFEQFYLNLKYMKFVLATALLLAFPVYQTNSTLGILGGLWGKHFGTVQYTGGHGVQQAYSGYNLQQAAQPVYVQAHPAPAPAPSQSYTTNNYFNNVNSAQVANQYGGNGGGSQNVHFQATYNGGKGGKGGSGGRAKLSNQFNNDRQVTVSGQRKNAREFAAQLDNSKAYYNKGSGCHNCINDALNGKKNVFVNVDRKKSYLVNKKRFGPGQYGDLSLSADGVQIVQDTTDPAELEKLVVVEEVEGEFEVQDVSDELVENQ